MRSNNPSRHAHRSNILRNSRRGESTIIANLILFIAVMGMAGATVVVFKNMMEQSTTAATEEKDRSIGVMRTDFVIPSATYSAGTVTAYVKNTGRQSFDPEDLDVYLDGIRIPRDVSNRTITITSDSDTYNVGIWDTNEDLEFVITYSYAAPASHTISVYAPNGVKSEGIFSS